MSAYHIQLIVAEVRDRQSAQPGAEEAADLVRQQRQPEQGRQVAHAEQLADDRRGRRHGRQPGEAEADRRTCRRSVRCAAIARYQATSSAREPYIEKSTYLLRYFATQRAGVQAADDVGQPDDRQRPARDRRRQAAQVDFARQVRDEEGDVETAGEEAGVQQQVAAVADGARASPRECRRRGATCASGAAALDRAAGTGDHSAAARPA